MAHLFELSRMVSSDVTGGDPKRGSADCKLLVMIFRLQAILGKWGSIGNGATKIGIEPP